jgi:hypothetical protein
MDRKAGNPIMVAQDDGLSAARAYDAVAAAGTNFMATPFMQ